VALVYGELYSALRSVNVPHELAQEAARVDNISPKNVTIAKLESHLRCVQLLLALNIVLVLILLAAA
jgi:hypothetical protein